MVKGQQDRDGKISNLVRTMEDTYSFVALVDELKKNQVLQDVVEQILKQTIECGFFIQEYARRNFAGRCEGSRQRKS
ncbi:MAG: hypothetical protein QOE37_2264 [Microbacteriaceae bacterium]|nr:hypothetical protein [Microbacteriaceae bacterium]